MGLLEWLFRRLRTRTFRGDPQYAASMTITHGLLGREIDAPPASVPRFQVSEERKIVRARLAEAEQHGDVDAEKELKWELGVLDLNLLPRYKTDPPHFAPDWTEYERAYGLDEATISYAETRVRETRRPAVRLQHLEFLIYRTAPKGRAWIRRCRETAEAYRSFIDTLLNAMKGETAKFAGLRIADAVKRAAELVGVRGVLSSEEETEWACWIVGVAQTLRGFDWPDDDGIKMQHRWPFEILEHLTAIPAERIANEDRERALSLLEEAHRHYSAEPLADTFTVRVAEVDAELRKHFGEAGTHERMIRRQYETLLGRAEMHRGSGHEGYLVAQHFYRSALELADMHGQYFSREEREYLKRAEREMIAGAVEAGEFAVISSGPIELDPDQFDRTADSAEATVERLVSEAPLSIPDLAEVGEDIDRQTVEFPLQGLFPRTYLQGGKVVGQPATEEERKDAEVVSRLCLFGFLIGQRVHVTLSKGQEGLALTYDQLLDPFRAIGIEDDRLTLVGCGFERFLAKDYVSALHILVPQFEGLLRDQLGKLGVPTTAYRRESARTDDATLGELLRSRTADDQSVEELLGTDVWNFFRATLVEPVGWNLRNRVAHGLMTAAECRPDVTGLVVHHLIWLVAFARRRRTP